MHKRRVGGCPQIACAAPTPGIGRPGWVLVSETWRLRSPPIKGLVLPVAVDPDGLCGPTKGQASGPRWRRSSPGLYVPATVDGEVPEQRVLEAAQRLPDDGAVTGWASLRLRRGGFFDGRGRDGRTPLPVPLLVPPHRNLRPLPGTTVERTLLATAEVEELHGVPCTTALRATHDAARTAPGLRAAVAVVDMACSGGLVSLPAFRAYAAAHRRRVGSEQACQAALLADDRVLSPRETEMRLIWVLDAGLPRPRCNWPVLDAHGRRLARPDLLDPALGVAGEYDGADHRGRRRHAVDVARHEAFREVGLETVVAVGEDLDDVGRVVARIHAAVRRAAALEGRRTFTVAVHPGPL